MAKTTRIKVKRGSSKALVGRVVAAAHPDYKGRKVAVELVPLGTPVSRDPADGGTYSRLALVSLERAFVATQVNPTRAQAVYGPEVFGLLVAWDHYQGADCGITIYLPMVDGWDVAVDGYLAHAPARSMVGAIDAAGATRDLYWHAALARADALREGERAAA